VDSDLHTISKAQTTNQELVKKSVLRRIVFDKSRLRCISFHKKIWPAAHVSDLFFSLSCVLYLIFKFRIHFSYIDPRARVQNYCYK